MVKKRNFGIQKEKKVSQFKVKLPTPPQKTDLWE